MTLYWRPVKPTRKLREMRNVDVLISVDGTNQAVIGTVSPAPTQKDRHRFVLAYHSSSSPRRREQWYGDGRDPISKVAQELMGTSNVSMLTIPPIVKETPTQEKVIRGAMITSGITFLILFTSLLIAPGPLTGLSILIPVLIMTAGLIWWKLVDQRFTVLVPGEAVLRADNIVEYARRRAAGENPEIGLDQDRRTAIEARVQAIKQEYGELTTDIVYRIENSALFDTADPLTERFHVALISWENHTSQDITELDRLASEVEVAYSVARDHAETVGITHLPETSRRDAERSVGAARLAQGATTEGERQASLRQVARILENIALYYLPQVDGETLGLEPPRN